MYLTCFIDTQDSTELGDIDTSSNAIFSNINIHNIINYENVIDDGTIKYASRAVKGIKENNMEKKASIIFSLYNLIFIYHLLQENFRNKFCFFIFIVS